MNRLVHMLTFLGMFAVILTLSHFYLFTRINHYLQLSGGGRRNLALILIGFGVLTLLSLPISRMLPREAASVVSWIVFPWMGILLLMLVIMFATDMTWIVLKLASPTPMHDPERRMFIQRAFGLVALGATGLVGGFSFWKVMQPVSVKPISIALNRLPKSLDGLRLVQITDLHIGPMVGHDWLKQVVDKVNALKPDLIAITGDLVDGSVDELRNQVAPLAELTAPLGVYFITGNHEYYSGVEEWCAHIASMGVRVLRNERVSIVAGSQGDSFDLAGVDDWRSSTPPAPGYSLPKALAGRDPNKALVLLAHQPVAVQEASEHGVDLQLSGHTHGGQIWPFTYLVYLQQPYVEGLHRHSDTTQIYVSPGTGFWGPPMRFGTTAEITHVTLKSAA